MKHVLIPIFLLFAINIHAQSIEKRLAEHQSAYPIEKIYISHNQPHYASRDTLYGKLFLVNGRSHQYFDGSPIVYVDWINEAGKSLESFILKVKDGTANISIPLLQEYGEGQFFLRAYTQYQKNYEEEYIFQKEIKIIGETPLKSKENRTNSAEYSVQFFPEVGRLVAGLKSVVAT